MSFTKGFVGVGIVFVFVWINNGSSITVNKHKTQLSSFLIVCTGSN